MSRTIPQGSPSGEVIEDHRQKNQEKQKLSIKNYTTIKHAVV